ncbi:MAG: hypothetical protein IKZ67_07720, partial [Paludibacteraceae bacterium]|nr:hypothetical protein [Paludibacteraceae bacterium]
MKNFIIALSVLFTANVYAEEDSSESSYYPNGFKMQIERSTWGINVAKDLDEDNRCITTASGLSINFGYQQNAHLYYGCGVGYRLKSEDFFDDFFLSVPVYGDIRFYASDQKVVPFIGLKVGYCISVIGRDDQDYDVYQDSEQYWYYNTSEYQYRMKGLYVRPDVGVRIKKVGISIGIPIVENVRVQTKFNNQRLNTTEHRKTGMDVGVNLSVSYNFC